MFWEVEFRDSIRRSGRELLRLSADPAWCQARQRTARRNRDKLSVSVVRGEKRCGRV